MKQKGIFGAVLLLFLLITLTACEDDAQKEAWKSVEQIEQEEEKKWGMEFQYVASELAADGEDMLWYFQCSDGVQFVVYGTRSFFMGGRETCEYYDCLNSQYLYAHADEIFAPLNQKGYDVQCLEHDMAGTATGIHKNFFANITSEDQLETFLTDVQEVKLAALTPVADSWIASCAAPSLGLRYGDVILGDYTPTKENLEQFRERLREAIAQN